MTAQGEKRSGRRGWVWPVVGVTVAGTALAGWLVVAQRGDAAEAPLSAATFAAKRGPLLISVTESGTIKSREQVIVKSEVEGQTTILYLIPEGTRVKKGDLLVELDASALLDRQAEKQITVLNAESAFVAARENLEVVKNQAQAEIAQAELDARFAKEDLQNYNQGEYPNALTEARAKITLAEEELRRVEEKARWSRKLYEEKYISQTELQADLLAENRARLDLELAKQALDLLENYTSKRRVAELESNVEQTALALERVKRKASADIAQAESELKARDYELTRQRDLLEKINRQIERCKIYAPTEGLVVYATTGRGGFRGNDEPLQEGQSVRERQEIIYLPTTASVMAEVSVHESNLDRVRPGLPARVTVDALPGRVFTGRVTFVAPLPDQQSVWMNPDLKVYKTQIDISGEVEGLRTGMTCRAEIIVEQHPDAVYVPVQSVMRVKGRPTVYVVGPDGKAQPREVDLGLDNNRMAHIQSGLREGELVLLTPPLAEASAEAQQLAETPEGGAAEGVAAPGVTTAAPAPAGGGAPAPPPGGERARGEGPPGDGPRVEGTPGEGQRRGRGRGNMTPEQMEEMRRRFENMSPEERERFRQQRQRQGGDGGERPGGPGGEQGVAPRGGGAGGTP